MAVSGAGRASVSRENSSFVMTERTSRAGSCAVKRARCRRARAWAASTCCAGSAGAGASVQLATMRAPVAWIRVVARRSVVFEMRARGAASRRLHSASLAAVTMSSSVVRLGRRGRAVQCRGVIAAMRRADEAATYSTNAMALTGEPSAPSIRSGSAMKRQRGTPIWSRLVRYSMTVMPAGKKM